MKRICALVAVLGFFGAGALFLNEQPANAHYDCSAPVNYQSSPQGYNVNTLAGCSHQHNHMMVSVCMQRYSSGSWACIPGSYHSADVYNSPGPISLNSGYYCYARMRGRVHLQAWNNSGVKVHDILNFGGERGC